MQDQPVPVIFRCFTDARDVVAIFPTIPGDACPSTCLSYQHIGQHGTCSPDMLTHCTRPATDEEREPLRRELEGIGYRLRIVKRQSPQHRRVRTATLRALGI